VIPRNVLIAIAMAVQKAGGDHDDVDDLVWVWQRLEADKRGHVDRMRAEAGSVRCCCAGDSMPTPDGRCERCYGRVENNA
jgi:hypothetical protein